MDASGRCRDVAGGADDVDDGDDVDDASDPVDGGVGSDTSGPDTNPITINTDGLERLQRVFPAAVGQVITPIPAALNTDNDLENGNDELGRVVDASETTLGFARHIFTPVYCVAGVCEAIQFMMAFSAEYEPLAVYHPDDMQHRLMKYYDGLYEPFDAADMELLNSVFVDPPAVYEPVEEVEQMVEGTHGTAPTLPEFQPVTVRGSVFTVWYIIRYGQRTQVLLGEMEAADALR